MRRNLRILLVAVLGVAAVLSLAALLIPLFVDADTFRPTIETRLSRMIGRPVAMGRLSLSLLTGAAVRADRLEIGETPGTQPGTTASLIAGGARVRLALLPLLRREVRIRSLDLSEVAVSRGGASLLRDARLRSRLHQAGEEDLEARGTVEGLWGAIPGSPAGKVAFDIHLREDRLEVRRLRADMGEGFVDLHGQASGLRAGAPAFSLEGRLRAGGSHGAGEASFAPREDRNEVAFRLSMDRVDFDEVAQLAGWAASGTDVPPSQQETGGEESSIDRLAGTGILEARQGRFAGVTLRSMSTRVRLDHGILQFVDTGFDVYGGRHRGGLKLDLVALGVPFELRSRIEGADAAELVTAFSGSPGGPLHGTATVDLDVVGVAYAPELYRTLGGGFALDVRDGKIASVGILAKVAGLLEAAGGGGIGRDETPFERLGGTFQVVAGVAYTQDLLLDADDLELRASGTVDLEGPLQLEAMVAFSPDVSAAMAAKTPALRVRLDSAGRLTVPLRVRGTLRQPEIQVDVARILREGLGRAVQDEVEDRLKEELSDRKKELLDRLLKKRR